MRWGQSPAHYTTLGKMRDFMFFSDELNKNNSREIEEIKEFLSLFQVNFDYPDKTFVIRDKGKIVATGSADSNILKYFFACKKYSGQGLIGTIYKSLLNHLFESGYNSYFVFTTPNNKLIFESLGLKEVSSTESVSLFEGGFYNYHRWMKKTKDLIGEKSGTRGSIIMNCNPMTLGHRYLIDRALEEVDDLIIFVVEEDKSIFPLEDRFNIIKEELAKEEKVTLLKGGPYIISQATFPTYFLKEKDQMLEVYTDLDGKIFASKIAKDLEIDIRFLGTEPKDPVTLAYNRSLKKILGKEDIRVEVIERKKLDEEVISASLVRKLLKEGKKNEAYKYLPSSTIEYLESEKGLKIIDKIRKG